MSPHEASPRPPWSPDSFRAYPAAQRVPYEDPAALARAHEQLRRLPPLVTPWEVDRLRAHLAAAQRGERFVLQGGDCAETFADCTPEVIAGRLKILLQMSLVLIHGGERPVVRVGRFAGQYAKPRSKPTETRDGVTLPSYFGDLVNRAEFTPEARRADPGLLLQGYHHAALTLNYVRALTSTGFADLHHPEYWDLSFFERAGLSPELKREYQEMSGRLSEALRFVEALGERAASTLSHVEFYTSHEGLHLEYEAAQVSAPKTHPGAYLSSTHLPWIGERTREVTGAHVELFRGLRNPVGVKLGPGASAHELRALCAALDPQNEPGRLVLITRMGADRVASALPPLLRALRDDGRHALWVCDPMHGNTRSTADGVKTRHCDDILREIDETFEAHASEGTHLGGIHFELTGEDVTECVGAGLSEADLARNYASACDPRLNYRQALELAFRVARRLRDRSTRGGPSGARRR